MNIQQAKEVDNQQINQKNAAIMSALVWINYVVLTCTATGLMSMNCPPSYTADTYSIII